MAEIKTIRTPRLILACIVSLLLIAALSYVFANALLYSKNTLMHQGGWVSTQEYLQAKTMAPNHYYYQRNAVRANRLDLSAWHGYQEVSPEKVFALGKLGFDFKLEEDAYLSVIFNRDQRGYEGIRLSRNAKMPTMFFRAGRDGKFISKQELETAIQAGWQKAQIVKKDSSIVLSINGSELGSFSYSPKEKQIVSFRGAKLGAVIDNVALFNEGMTKIFATDFSLQPEDAFFYLKTTSYALLLFICLMCLAALFMRKKGLGSTVAAGLYFNAVTLAMAVSVFAFDYYHWSSIYLAKAYNPTGHDVSQTLLEIEAKRNELFTTDIPQTLKEYLSSDHYQKRNVDPFIIASIAKGVPEWVQIEKFHVFGLDKKFQAFEDREFSRVPKKAKGELRIGFVGSSQTFGVGAEIMEDTIPAQAREFIKLPPNKKEVVSFNFGVPGSWSKDLVDRYREYWRGTELDIVVINLSHNDHDPNTFEQCLREFLFINQQMGIKTAFVLEATNPEYDSYLADNHNAMRKVAKEWGVPTFDLFALFRQEDIRDSGFLWWDSVHHSSLGQKIAAEKIAEFINKEVIPSPVLSLPSVTRISSLIPKG